LGYENTKKKVVTPNVTTSLSSPQMQQPVLHHS